MGRRWVERYLRTIQYFGVRTIVVTLFRQASVFLQNSNDSTYSPISQTDLAANQHQHVMADSGLLVGVKTELIFPITTLQ